MWWWWQDHVMPLYYQRSSMGYSPEWIRMAKRSMATTLPRFNSARMVGEYLSKFYLPATKQGHRIAQDAFRAAQEVAAWKAQVHAAWPGVTLARLDTPARRIQFGESVLFEVGIRLNGLQPRDVWVELLFERPETDRAGEPPPRHELIPDGSVNDAGEHRFVLELSPDRCGRLDYRIRCYPRNALLAHPFELGLMLWV